MSNAVKHPSHYTEGRKYEPKDVIRDWGLNFNLGNAVKYIARAGRKDDIIQDLKKVQEYIQFEIEAIEEERKQANLDVVLYGLGALSIEDAVQDIQIFSHPIIDTKSGGKVRDLILLDVPAEATPDDVLRIVLDTMWENVFKGE